MSRRVERLQDEVLVLEYRAGDIGALEQLISHWQPRVYTYVLTMLGDDEAAWDVSQEVWMGAISGLGKRKRIENFAGWIYRVAHNKAISHLRKKKRLKEREEKLPEAVEGEGGEAVELAFAAEDAGLVRACLVKLPVAQREVLTLFYLDALSLDEIGRILSVAKGTVQSRLHYGRKKMKELLLKGGYDHEVR